MNNTHKIIFFIISLTILVFSLGIFLGSYISKCPDSQPIINSAEDITSEQIWSDLDTENITEDIWDDW